MANGLIFTIATLLVGASATDGNSFLLLAISIMRLFGNEDRHSRRPPHLHMAKVFAV
jgi:hypothetical protein